MTKIANNVFQAGKKFIVRNRLFFHVFIQLVTTSLAFYLAFVIRFESFIFPSYINLFLQYVPLILIIRLVCFSLLGLQKNLWRYASIYDLVKIIISTTLGSILFFICVRYLIGNTYFPRSVFALDWLLLIFLSGGSRLFIRVAMLDFLFTRKLRSDVLIIGDAEACETIIREMRNNPKSPYDPIGIIDTDPFHKGLEIHGVPIFGSIDILPEMIEKHKPNEILISMPSGDNNAIKAIYELCKPYNIPIKKLPGLNDILGGNISVSDKLGQSLVNANVVTKSRLEEAMALQKKEGGRIGSKLVQLGYLTEEDLVMFLSKHYRISDIKPISLEDLLQREPVRTDIKSVRDFIEGKSVLVTGAGGSIGSELCRQIMKYNPSNLILLDRYENSLFEVDLELTFDEFGNKRENFISEIGDILDTGRLDALFLKHKPQIVFHAAAHKHVPLMEGSPVEAVKNNIFGTKNLIDRAAFHKVKSFVMISTDKAVNPSSVMGATKRVAEFLTINKNASSSTKFRTVRFGNVLGSNGSVITIFKDQIKQGGPITVTHQDMKRFFMLIPEAVQLVLVAAASGNGGEIFVLDMGEQIKIVDLAENLIRLSGFIPHEEIRIEYTGLRPGEKLYEELFDETETIIPARHDKMRMAIPKGPSVKALNEHMMNLERIVRSNAVDEVIPAIQKIVPNFKCGYSSKTEESAPKKKFNRPTLPASRIERSDGKDVSFYPELLFRSCGEMLS